MITYKELVYMVLDELKLVSDDSTFTEDHVILLLNNYRALLLKLKYSDIKKLIPLSNYQTIDLHLEPVESNELEPHNEVYYLLSIEKVPSLLELGNTRVFYIDYFEGDIAYISKLRMRYIGYNKYMKNIIYAAIGPDNKLYLKSKNGEHTLYDTIKIYGLFSDLKEALDLLNGDTPYNILDLEFPLEEGMISTLIQMVVKELAGPSWKPEDDENNATDDLANLATYIARNAKSNLQKKMEE